MVLLAKDAGLPLESPYIMCPRSKPAIFANVTALSVIVVALLEEVTSPVRFPILVTVPALPDALPVNALVIFGTVNTVEEGL